MRYDKMKTEDLNEAASNKIYAKLQMLLNEKTSDYYNCGVSDDVVKRMLISYNREVEIFQYIYGLIEKDNTL
jgi:hypothetical protein